MADDIDISAGYVKAPPPPSGIDISAGYLPAQATVQAPLSTAINPPTNQNATPTPPASKGDKRETGITREGITGGKDWLFDALTAPGTFLGRIFQPFKEPTAHERMVERASGQPTVGNLPDRKSVV